MRILDSALDFAGIQVREAKRNMIFPANPHENSSCGILDHLDAFQINSGTA